MTDSARIVVVDNYDSFVYTIVGYLKTLGATVDVVRNDAIDPSDASVLDEYDGVLISPGPALRRILGASEDVIRLCAKLGKPMFGVCLGLQRSPRCSAARSATRPPSCTAKPVSSSISMMRSSPVSPIR